jgi:hypothetical protein
VGKAIGNRGLPGVGWSGLSSRPRSIMSCGRNTRDEDRRQCTGQASLPFHGNPLPLNGMGFYPALWQEFGNFGSLSDHSRAALRRHGADFRAALNVRFAPKSAHCGPPRGCPFEFTVQFSIACACKAALCFC